VQSPEYRTRAYLASLKWFAKYLPVTMMFGLFPLEQEERVFERTINRIHRTMARFGSHALIYWDEGKQAEYTKLCRKLRVHNYIQSQFGTWPDGKRSRNIQADLILEDPVFLDSSKSMFIQVTDLCAYALLR